MNESSVKVTEVRKSVRVLWFLHGGPAYFAKRRLMNWRDKRSEEDSGLFARLSSG